MYPKQAEYWIQNLDLKPHPEGGFYNEVYRSTINIDLTQLPKGYTGKRKLITSIYYLLRSGDTSKFHRLKSDEIWYFHAGSCLKIYLIDNEGKKHVKLVGNNPDKAENLSVLIPSGNLFAAEVVHPDTYGLVSCVVSPGFEFEDFQIFDKEDLIQAYPKHTELFDKFC